MFCVVSLACELAVDGGGWFGFTCWFFVVGCDFADGEDGMGVERSKGGCIVEIRRCMVVVVVMEE